MTKNQFTLSNGVVLTNVHPPTLCVEHPCVIHAPTDHHMRAWPLHWRTDRAIFERICPHGVGHYDPDQRDYHISIGQPSQSIHGCDGCCDL